MTQQDEKALAVNENETLAMQPNGSNPIAAMLTAVIEKGLTAENAETAQRICDLYLKMEAVGAKKQYMAAKAALQAELPTVMATKAIPSKDGTIRSTFAPYEEIMAVVQPFLNKHGFSVGFNIRPEPDGKRLAAICTLSHAGGHSESNEFAVRVGQGPPGCSEAQSDGAARSYARRGALCDALNIVVDHDTDARLEGAVISAEDARALRNRLRAVNGNEAAFLKFAGAKDFATIREARLPVLERELAAMEKKRVMGAATRGTAPDAATPGGGSNPAGQEITPSSAPTPSPSRQRLYDLLRAVAKARGKTFDDQWKLLTIAAKCGGVTLRRADESYLPELITLAEKVVKKEKIDAAPFLEGGPNHQALPTEPAAETKDRMPGEE